MKLEYDNNLGQLINIIQSNIHNDECKTMLYAADDFDDFIAFPKYVEAVDNSKLSNAEMQYLKEHNASQFAIIQCGKAFMRQNCQIEESQSISEAKTAMSAKQLCEALEQLDAYTLLRASTDDGKMRYFIVECDFHGENKSIDIDIPPLFALYGSF